MNIRVADVYGAESLCNIPTIDGIISIAGTYIHDAKRPLNLAQFNRKVLELTFDDACGFNEPGNPQKLPSKKDCDDIFNFVSNNNFGDIVIHCQGGVSRSGAIFIILKLFFEKIEVDNAFDFVKKLIIEHGLFPNMRLVWLLSKRFGMSREYVKIIDNVSKEYSKIV